MFFCACSKAKTTDCQKEIEAIVQNFEKQRLFAFLPESKYEATARSRLAQRELTWRRVRPNWKDLSLNEKNSLCFMNLFHKRRDEEKTEREWREVTERTGVSGAFWNQSEAELNTNTRAHSHTHVITSIQSVHWLFEANRQGLHTA